MTNRNEGITIYLTIGKEVKLNFDSENNLSSIRLYISYPRWRKSDIKFFSEKRDRHSLSTHFF